MATLNGIVRFSGQLGDFIFYRKNKKDVVRSKPGAYQLSENSKKSAQDFGEASKNAAYIRKAFGSMVRDYGYGDLNSRLTKRIAEIFKTIPAADAGHKKLADGNLKLIEGFEFNAATRLDRLLFQLPKFTWKPEGSIALLFPKIALKQLIKPIPRASAFFLQLMVFNFDLNDGDYETLNVNDLQLPLDVTDFPGATLTIPIQQEGHRAVLVALGISYLHDRHRKDDRRYFACQIVHAMHLLDGVEVTFVAPEEEKTAPLEEAQSGLSWTLGE